MWHGTPALSLCCSCTSLGDGSRSSLKICFEQSSILLGNNFDILHWFSLVLSIMLSLCRVFVSPCFQQLSCRSVSSRICCATLFGHWLFLLRPLAFFGRWLFVLVPFAFAFPGHFLLILALCAFVGRLLFVLSLYALAGGWLFVLPLSVFTGRLLLAPSLLCVRWPSAVSSLALCVRWPLAVRSFALCFL